MLTRLFAIVGLFVLAACHPSHHHPHSHCAPNGCAPITDGPTPPEVQTAIHDIQVIDKHHYTRVVIIANRPLDPEPFFLGSGGRRAVYDFPRLDWALPGRDIGQGQKSGPGAGCIQRYRFAQHSPTKSRLVFDLAMPALPTGRGRTHERDGMHHYVVDYKPVMVGRYNQELGLSGPAYQQPKGHGPYHSQLEGGQPSGPTYAENTVHAAPSPLTAGASTPASSPTPVRPVSQAEAAPLENPFARPEAAPTPAEGPRTLFNVAHAEPEAQSEVTTLVQGRGRFVVVIDPGHGGFDSGAVTQSGVVEKQLTLAVARKLRDNLLQHPHFTVLMTRDGDEALSLEERLSAARKGGADLFISLHADSLRAGPAVRGASVYTLSQRGAERARSEVVGEDNWLIGVARDDSNEEINDILYDLTEVRTRTQSDQLASLVVGELEQVGPLVRNTHRRAGYYVLLAPDVPAVLVELGFLSNARDARRLQDVAHQGEIADALARAVTAYFNSQQVTYAAFAG